MARFNGCDVWEHIGDTCIYIMKTKYDGGDNATVGTFYFSWTVLP